MEQQRKNDFVGSQHLNIYCSHSKEKLSLPDITSGNNLFQNSHVTEMKSVANRASNICSQRSLQDRHKKTKDYFERGDFCVTYEGL